MHCEGHASVVTQLWFKGEQHVNKVLAVMSGVGEGIKKGTILLIERNKHRSYLKLASATPRIANELAIIH